MYDTYLLTCSRLLHISLSCYQIDINVSCGVSEAKPTCGVITRPPVRGQNVTLSCSMTYRWLTERRRSIPGAEISASISWDSAAGTFLRNASTAVTNINGSSIGETLQVDVMTLVSGAVIPSYNCTSSFHFTDSGSAGYTFALNDVSWTCVSAPVVTWCRPIFCILFSDLIYRFLVMVVFLRDNEIDL